MSEDWTEIQRALGRVEGKLDTALTGMSKQDARLDKQEERLGNVERRQWWVAGVFAAIGAALGIGGTHGLKP
jgi:hypothetical protein